MRKRAILIGLLAILLVPALHSLLRHSSHAPGDNNTPVSASPQAGGPQKVAPPQPPVLAATPLSASVAAVAPGQPAGATSVPVPAISENVRRQITALEKAKAARTPAQKKMDSQLIFAAQLQRGEPLGEGIASLRLDLDRDDQGRVLTDIDARVNDRLIDQIAAAGGRILSQFPQYNAIRAALPVDQIEPLAARSDVLFIRPAVPAVLNAGSVNSEGDATHAAPSARAQFGVNGSGVKVGVLSDSVDHLAEAQASSDLGTVGVLPGQAGTGAGEGTAMLEIVHDLAPGAELHYATGFGGPANFAQNIRDLRFQSHCDIIIDDITYANESPFQDGLIAKAVNDVIADGALYFSSAANSGNKSDGTSCTWEGDFVDAGDFPLNGQSQGRLHSFGGAAFNTAIKGGRVNFFWADPLGAAANDYDIYITDASGGSVIAAGNTTQNGTQDPYEFAQAQDGQRILIVKFSGAPRFMHLEASRGRFSFSTSGSTRGHNAAKDAFTVAAVDASTSYPNGFTGNAKNPVETFSSDGLRHVFFNSDGTPITPGDFSSTGGTTWQKPDIAAADGVKTTLPADSGLNPFFGTSAAAPHAGAVAALLKSYNPALTPAQVRAILTSTALDIESPGVDRDSGAGIVMALQALQAAPTADQASIASFTPAGAGVGANVAIDGSKLNGATSVKFNGTSAAFTVDSATHISTTVPVGATTGKITVTTPAGVATSANNFTVLATPAITAFTPSSGAVGSSVVVSGANLTGTTAVQFNGVNAPVFTVNSATQITVTVPATATTGRISVSTPAGNATSGSTFTVTVQPNIASFTPVTGGVGTTVIINGANLAGATQVKFNGVNAPAFTVDSATRISVNVPVGATSGQIAVTTGNGTAISATSFTVVPAPSITAFSPGSGAAGDSIGLTGANFTGATAVKFNGISAVFALDSSSHITAMVPAAASSGALSITTPGGTATSGTAFTVVTPPANDNFANAQVISGDSGAVQGSNLAATKEPGEPIHGGNAGGKSVWYRWTAPSTGVWQFDTIGSAFHTELAAYSGTTLGDLAVVARSDDPAATNSIVKFVAVSGTTYQIAVDGFRSEGGSVASTASGQVKLNWATTAAPVISGFSPPSGSAGASVTITGGNLTGATVKVNGIAAAVTQNSATAITITVPAGATTGTLQVTTASGSARSATEFAVLSPPANDDFAQAQAIAGNSGTISGRNTDATKESGEPDHAANPGGHSIWYSWTAPANGRFTFDTVGSGIDTLLAIYTGGALNSLTAVASNDDASPGTISRAGFTASSGTVYRIAVDGHNGASGPLTLNWAFTPNLPAIASFAPNNGPVGSTVVINGSNFVSDSSVRVNGVLATTFTVDSTAQITFVVPPGANSGPITITTEDGVGASAAPFVVTTAPVNDNLASAQPLTGSATIVVGRNIGATKEDGEPNHANDPGGRSVWYRWTAPSAGTWVLDTAGSSFDTTLAAYTGTAVGSLALVAQNDDAREDRTSRVLFDATAGTTYRIAVDGYGGDAGGIVLKLLPATPPQVIYSTGFETSEGFSIGPELAGQNGWEKANAGGNGIVEDYFPGLGQQAFVGYSSFSGDNLFVWKALNFTPQTNSRPVIRFSVLMGIVDSLNFFYDSFDWSIYNRSGQRLFSIDFDNYLLGIYYLLDDQTGYHDTGAAFDNESIYDLQVTMDFARNRWNATLDGQPIVTEQPITTTGAALDLGDVDAVWLISNSFIPGDNFMVFDEYRIEAEPSQKPAIVRPPQDQTVIAGSSAAFAVVASGEEALQYQWRFNGVALANETNAVLTVNNVNFGQAGTYSVTVSNTTGAASGSATLTVAQPAPIQFTGVSRLSDGRLRFTVGGTPGSHAIIEFSSDAVHWQELGLVSITDGSLVFVDPEAGRQSQRFYRARFQP